ncbi:MAG: sigma-54-dependent Fis family transcriptional regulator [Candidatus Marinimicrobia bacterium]|jgi:DNA-binding NtrC family response regulator|nr:sigma-54-dependent Fis family transcriptional regulator [Candidatus Neomarinimicrobiota bacterium]MBT3496012.1 sigma-54-dependent Fis family transcriptional regulator [Candidatus Neomarinimicrobiota bacterium]MBT3691865.1 sigma-54-dependent Fis family transcriptional regulator [Candidatus Neomarinimicrobiota bacterium]MBT3732520.1 sigma-54-dependent Fis family transcriptional regulator [Candidatus Neomarinimicrobiota bacterium]MBT4144652.1 sigma-54-dependent Fis family transcriptional regula
MKILLIEDEKILRISLSKTLQRAGYAVYPCDDGGKAISILGKEIFDLVLTDIRLPGKSGLDILKHIQKKHPNIKVIMMTAFGSVESAVGALKMGASDYLTKPFSQEELLHKLATIRDYQFIEKENIELKQKLNLSKKIIGNSPPFLNLIEKVSLTASSDHSILIEGESGTGKELIVDLIHEMSDRSKQPLIKVNCAALSESLFESELFGHEKGAFTGALKQNIGRFERANGGTLFIDDIDDLPMSLQVKLLRVIQENEIERVGGDKTISIDVRILAATKVNLQKKMEDGAFRDDLFYRLNVVHLPVPSLRDRPNDIPLLAAHFIGKHGSGHHITPAVMNLLQSYPWPGNVRELENAVIQMIALSQGDTLVASLLPKYLQEQKNHKPNPIDSSLSQTISSSEKTLIKEALEKCKWRQTDAAKLLNLPRTTLRSKMKKYGLVNN